MKSETDAFYTVTVTVADSYFMTSHAVAEAIPELPAVLCDLIADYECTWVSIVHSPGSFFPDGVYCYPFDCRFLSRGDLRNTMIRTLRFGRHTTWRGRRGWIFSLSLV